MTTDTATTPSIAPRDWLARRSRWSPFELAFWLATLLPFFLFPSYLPLANQIAIAALFALSVDLILGYAGIVTLGHAMFFGLGAYCAGIISVRGWGEPLTGLLAAGAFAGVVGFVASFVVTRVQHLALIMVTLGLGFLTYELANALHWLTGGTDGLRGISTWPVLGQFRFDMWGYTSYGYALIVLFVCFLFSRLLVNSSFGLALRGIRENVKRMPAIGADHKAHLRLIYAISAAMAGLAGGLLAQTTNTVALDSLSFERSADVVVMLILGGTGRLYGAILGTLIFLVARDQLAGINPQYWYFGIGLLLMAVVLFMPKGILGFLARIVDRSK
jgi:branched-chain amino acid transport system permease protein